MITVFTPTFNRKDKISNLYFSLCSQKFLDFEWLVIDDGSTDNTELYFDEILKENKINIRYYKKNNGGKHTAFNMGIELAKGDIFICVDSDDTLIPDALKIINESYLKYYNDNIAGFVYLKGYDINNCVTKYYQEEESIKNYNEYIINRNFKGDKAEVFVTNILKKYRFPVYENEKFLAEGFLWSIIGREYDYVFINKIIYLCEYLPNGLTKSGRKLRMNNPMGGLAHSCEYLDKKIYCLKIRIKNSILYNIYKKKCMEKYKYIPRELCKNSILIKIFFIPSLFLFYKWDKK